MLIRNTTDSAIFLPTLGVEVEPGDTFEATGDTAKELLGRDEFARADRPKRTAKKTEAAPADDSDPNTGDGTEAPEVSDDDREV